MVNQALIAAFGRLLTARKNKTAGPKPRRRSPIVNHDREGSVAVLLRTAADALAATMTFEKRQRRTAMALKVELKPHERIIVGSCVITNTDQRARLLIDGDNIPILREKDILTPETADTPAKLVYLAVQLMYISPDPQSNHGTYFNLVRDIVTAVPSAWPIIEGINNNILTGDLYRALKEARKLIAYEKKLQDIHQATQKMNDVGTAA
jgi:flagellar biosynthesis repressor protein FlbT